MLKTSILAMTLLSVIESCPPAPVPNPTPTPIPTPDVPPDGGRICVPFELCDCWIKPPGEDWGYLGDCPTEPLPSICPYGFPPDVGKKLVTKRHGQGVDATVKVCMGNVWCLKNTGKNQYCCPPAPEGSDYELACNAMVLYQQCPRWEYNVGTGWKECTSKPHPEFSCDHFDRNDPKTPEYNGTNPNCLKDGDPVKTGYWMIGHGNGLVRACDAGAICSRGLQINH